MNLKDLPMFIFAILGIAIAVTSYVSYGLGNVTNPGAGIFPFIIGSLATVISGSWCIISIVNWLRRGQLLPVKVKDEKCYRNELITGIGVMVVYAIALEGAGFLISTAIMLALSLCLIGKIRLWLSIAEAMGVSFISYFLFAKLLEVQLPKGYLWF